MGSRFALVGVLAVPTVLVAVVPALQFEHWQWVSLCLAAPVAVWGAAPFHRAAWMQLRRGSATYDTLLSLSVATAFGWSLVALFGGDVGEIATRQPLVLDRWVSGGDDQLYFGVLTALTWSALWGRWLEARWSTSDRASARAGTAALRARSDRRVSLDPTDWLAAVVVPLALVLAAGTLGFWLAASGDAAGAALAASAVVVLACPGGLGLAVPLVMAYAARRTPDVGVCIDDPAVLPTASKADTLVLRKATAVTAGEPWLVDVVVTGDVSVEETLGLVGSLGRRAEDPVGWAVVEAARERSVPLYSVEILADRPGLLRGVVDGHRVEVGRESLLADWARTLPAELARTKAAAEQAGRTVLLAGWDDTLRAVLVVGDPIRPLVAEAVHELKAEGVRPLLVTGESQATATAVARATGIDHVVANVAPEDTAAVVARLQDAGRVVVMLDVRSNRSRSVPASAWARSVEAGPALAAHRADLVVGAAAGHRHVDHRSVDPSPDDRFGLRTPDRSSDDASIRRQVTVSVGRDVVPDWKRERPDLWTAVDALRLGRAVHRLVVQNQALAFVGSLVVLPAALAGRLGPTTVLAVAGVSVAAVAVNSARILRFGSVRPPAHARHELGGDTAALRR